MEKPNWIIHVVSDDLCDICGDAPEKNAFLPGMCDAHTHGLDQYGSKELQFVIRFPDEYIGYILNEVGDRIKNGLKLHDDDVIEGLFPDGADLRVFETKDSEGKGIFRLLLPDGEFKYPEASDEYPYNMQLSDPYCSAKKS